MAASFAAILDSLPNEENKITVLEDLKTALGSLPHSHVAEIAANTSFHSVFECLGTDNRYAEKKFCCVMFLACLQLPSLKRCRVIYLGTSIHFATL